MLLSPNQAGDSGRLVFSLTFGRIRRQFELVGSGIKQI